MFTGTPDAARRPSVIPLNRGPVASGGTPGALVRKCAERPEVSTVAFLSSRATRFQMARLKICKWLGWTLQTAGPADSRACSQCCRDAEA